jgi:glutathione S-transferase
MSSSQPPLKLYYSPGACSFVPHVALLEADLNVDLILARVGQMTPEFSSINPKRRVPVLVINIIDIITEMSAVLAAISSLSPETNLLGRTALKTIRVYKWLNWLSTVAHGQALGSIWRPKRYSNDPSIYPAIREKGLETIRECYKIINEKVAEPGMGFAVGGALHGCWCVLGASVLLGEQVGD